VGLIKVIFVKISKDSLDRQLAYYLLILTKIDTCTGTEKMFFARGMYGVCFLRTRTPKYLALRSPERLLVKIFYIALSISRSFCFRPFSLSLTWLAVAGPPFIILSWPPPNLRHGNFGKSFVMAKKSFRGFRKLSGRSTMTRPCWGGTYKRFFNWRRRRNRRRRRQIRGPWTQRLPSPISGPKWRMTGGIVSGNSLRTMTFWLKRFMTLTTRICSSQKSGPVQ
jgi:hypothetical protein